MNYVFCGGYRTLLFALYLKSTGKNIVIVAYSNDVVKFCCDQKINYIQIKQFRPYLTSILKLFSFKRKLNAVIKKIDMKKEDNFFLTGYEISYEGFYLAKELAKKGRVYSKIMHRNLKIYQSARFRPFIRGWINKFIIKIVLGIDAMYYETNKDPRIGIDKNFREKHGIKDFAIDLSIEEIMFEAVKNYKIDFRRYDNLIIDHGIIENIVKTDSIISLFKRIFELNLEFCYKKHPKSHKYKKQREQIEIDYYKLFKDYDELPRHYPVELFFNNINYNVISLFSASLSTAAKLKNCRAISLLELIEWKNKSYKKEFKDHLIEQSNNKILFPDSFDELKKLLLKKKF